MRVLVTGGAGYFGSVLCRMLLDKGHFVRCVDNLHKGADGLVGLLGRENFHFVHEDVVNITNIYFDVDAVVHLAGIVGDPACAANEKMAECVNVEGLESVLGSAAWDYFPRFIFASTCSNYGKADKIMSEDDDLNPVSLYAEQKVTAEKHVLGYDNIRPTILRFSTLYGLSPNMRYDLTVNEFTRDLMTKKHLVAYGGQFHRPYVHVHDACRAVLRVLESPADKVAGEVFNVGGENFSKQRLVEMISEAMPHRHTIEWVEKDEDPRDYQVSFAKIQDKLGFRITKTVREGIQEIMQHVAETS